MHPTTREVPPVVRVGVATREYPTSFNPADDSNYTVDHESRRLFYRPDRLFLKTLSELAGVSFADVRPQIVQERYCSCIGRNKCVYGPGPYTKAWKPDFDYYLSLDDDIYLQAGQFMLMLDHAEENPDACVTALYRDVNATRGDMEQYAIGEFFLGEPECFTDKIIVEDVGFYEFAGLGAMLIPASVIVAEPYPCFQHGTFSAHRTDPENQGRSIRYFFEAQDDIAFCQRLLKRDIPLVLKGWAQHRDLLPGEAVLAYLKNY